VLPLTLQPAASDTFAVSVMCPLCIGLNVRVGLFQPLTMVAPSTLQVMPGEV
jgi:hypothetical protein